MAHNRNSLKFPPTVELRPIWLVWANQVPILAVSPAAADIVPLPTSFASKRRMPQTNNPVVRTSSESIEKPTDQPGNFPACTKRSSHDHSIVEGGCPSVAHLQTHTMHSCYRMQMQRFQGSVTTATEYGSDSTYIFDTCTNQLTKKTRIKP
jgi:hypothetical protein